MLMPALREKAENGLVSQMRDMSLSRRLARSEGEREWGATAIR